MIDAIALYVHWPFCQSKCPYCDFNSHVTEAIDHPRWRDALLTELDHYAAATPDRRLTSIFFGGGTPSLMEPGTAAAVIAAARAHWTSTDDLEVTLEANPSSAEKDRFIAYRNAGVNRLSLGIQSLNDDALRFLGRRHDAAEAHIAMTQAREVFERVSFDFIYARPGQTEAQWRDELSRLLEFTGDHLSLYQLTIEPGTPFFHDAVPAADEDHGVALFELTQELTAAAGLPAYEISNHAQPGAESRHNLTYWRGGDYAGIGPGAHGRLTSDDAFTATHQIHDPMRWLAAVERNGHGTGKLRILGGRERAEEILMTGLRLVEGLDTTALSAATGFDLSNLTDSDRLGLAMDGGFLVRDGAHLRTTPAGRLILNTLVGAILTAKEA